LKILVTGGAGFIGSNVVDAYVEDGHEVIVVDNLSGGYKENVNKKAKFYLVDVRSPLLEEVFKLEKPDLVNHHAAQMSVPYSVENPGFDADVNVLGLLNILQNCVKYSVKKVIFISSGGAVYGEADEYPTTENYAPKPLSPYAITKFVSENYLYYYKHQFNLDYAVLRYANVYGPRQVPHGEAGVVSIFIEKLQNGETPTVFAYPDEPDGMVRDYVFVGDVVEANRAVVEKGSGEAWNIGTGLETNTRTLYDTICRVMGCSIKPNPAGARKGDLKHSCLNVDKAAEGLGWKANHTLEEGVAKTYEYFKKG
jgi:UDP-glucose 4-epimerase